MEPDYYIFRIAEWTLAVEYGLLTGENLAWMETVEEDGQERRYRYDSWDMEHPVRKWRSASPVDPQYDSVPRLSDIARSLEMKYISATTPEPQIQYQPIPNEILDVSGWTVIYAEQEYHSYFGSWANYEFKFSLDDKYRNASNIKLVARYYYPRTDMIRTTPPEDRETGEGTRAEPSGAARKFMYNESPTTPVTTWTEIKEGENVDLGLSQDLSEVVLDYINAPPPPRAPRSMLQWTNWCEEFHAVDFVSYQYIFYVVWNYVASQFVDLSPEPFVPEDDTQESSNNYLPNSNTANPNEFYLTENQYLQFTQECVYGADYVDNWIRSNVRVKYFAQIKYAPDDGSPSVVEEVELTALERPEWDQMANAYGIPIDFEMPERIENCITWVPGNFGVSTGNLEEYETTFSKDGFGTTTVVTPGLQAAPAFRNAKFEDININMIDMSGAVLDDSMKIDLVTRYYSN